MQFRDDIMRGVRLAAIAFTGLLVVLIGYRMLHGAPSPAPAPKEVVRPAMPEKSKPPDPLVVPAPPPPPVAAHKSTVRRTAIKKEIVPPQTAPIIRNADPDFLPAPPAELPIHTVAAKDVFVPEPVTERVEESSAPQDQIPQKPPTRGKRALRAIGRFLHTGKQ